MTIAAGTKLGRYEIRSKIGAGGMGEVYLAQDTKLDRRVALKILPAEVAAHPDRMRRFVQEAKAASALNHPNIITIHEIDETDSGHFIATEFIDGETLRERMRNVELAVASAEGARVAVGKKSKPTPRRLWRALRDLVQAARQAQPFTPSTLHQFRVQCKKTRYLAELLPGNATLLEQLKTIQDAIGDWHDWLTLTQNAAKITGPSQSALLAHLENVTQAKFTHAVRTSKRIVDEIEVAASALKAGIEREKAELKATQAPAKKKTPLRVVSAVRKHVAG